MSEQYERETSEYPEELTEILEPEVEPEVEEKEEEPRPPFPFPPTWTWCSATSGRRTALPC